MLSFLPSSNPDHAQITCDSSKCDATARFDFDPATILPKASIDACVHFRALGWTIPARVKVERVAVPGYDGEDRPKGKETVEAEIWGDACPSCTQTQLNG